MQEVEERVQDGVGEKGGDGRGGVRETRVVEKEPVEVVEGEERARSMGIGRGERGRERGVMDTESGEAEMAVGGVRQAVDQEFALKAQVEPPVQASEWRG